ncbi:hypothetical protein D3C71_1670100 [compost metagenome]
MVFRAGHHVQRQAIRRAGPDETRLEREQVNIGDRRLAHGWRLNFQHATIGEETPDLSQDRCAFQQIGDGCTWLPACRFAHGNYSEIKQGMQSTRILACKQILNSSAALTSTLPDK